eukprot:2145539-Prymnesium_polylepis.2
MGVLPQRLGLPDPRVRNVHRDIHAIRVGVPKRPGQLGMGRDASHRFDTGQLPDPDWPASTGRTSHVHVMFVASIVLAQDFIFLIDIGLNFHTAFTR